MCHQPALNVSPRDKALTVSRREKALLMTEARQSPRGGRRTGPAGITWTAGRLSCRIENKIIINNARKREASGTISAGVSGEERRKCMCLSNKGGGTDFYRLGLAGARGLGGATHMLRFFSRWE